MILPTMNRQEISYEMLKDLQKLEDTTVNRICQEYERERKKLKIDKTKIYHREYTVRTAAKNNWLIIVRKSPTAPKYRGQQDTCCACIVYYYDEQGLKVMRFLEEAATIEVFTGHFFTRYNQRLNLGISKSIDIVKRYFANSGYLKHNIHQKSDGKWYNVSICREGMTLGIYLPKERWLVHKTFITKDMYRPGQDEKEQELVYDVQNDVLRVIAKPGYDPIEYQEKQDIVKEIMGY